MSKNHYLKSINPEIGDLALLAIEIWRLGKKFKKIEPSIGNDSISSIKNSIEKIKSFLSKKKIEIVDFTGSIYNDGLNVDVLSISDEKKDKPFISETIEPMVKYDGKIIKRAKVIVIK